MIFGRKKYKRIDHLEEEKKKPEKFYFGNRKVKNRLMGIRIPSELFENPEKIYIKKRDKEEYITLRAVQRILKYVDRTLEEPSTFKMHKEAIRSELMEFERSLSQINPKKLLSINLKYFISFSLDSIKNYLENPTKTLYKGWHIFKER